MKAYAVRREDDPFRGPAWRAAVQPAVARWPTPDPERGRPGVGYLILHQGEGADHLVQCWWDRENELFLRADIRRDAGEWRRAEEGEAACVWDLELMWAERNAYVETVLASKEEDGRPAYLGRLAGGGGAAVAVAATGSVGEEGAVERLLEAAIPLEGGLQARSAREDDVVWMMELERSAGVAACLHPDTRASHLAALADHRVVEGPDRRRVGFVLFGDLGRARVELRRMVMAERGRGYVRAVLRWSVSVAREVWGAETIGLDVHAENTRARRLYASEGFTPVGGSESGSAFVVMERPP